MLPPLQLETLKSAIHASPYVEPLLQLCRDVQQAGGRALLVGGSVRDALLGAAPKDLDVEVYHLAPEALLTLLQRRHKIDLVGRAFGVIKLQHLPLDVSLPRRESKSGRGHKGFEIYTDGALTLEEAARRRDFTVNALSCDPLSGELFDPYGGLADLAAGVLRHTSEQFAEDPLRVLRGMQFAARFEMRVAPETVALCRTLGLEGLPPERLFEEWKKMILRGVRPSLGLAFLRECGWINFFPELAALIGCEQEPEWHPEGDVWDHTLHCLDAFAAGRSGNEQEDLAVGLAVLCHDLGKPATTRHERGRIRSAGHEEAGEAPTRAFLERLTREADLIELVISLVKHHLRPQMLYDARSGDSAIRRLSARTRLDLLVRVHRADRAGRPPLEAGDDPAGDWLLARAHELAVARAAPRPLVQGRHLLPLGYQPGPELGHLLAACYEAQLDGLFTTTEAGVAWLQQRSAQVPKG